MLTVRVDESHAFDMLSILEIKRNNGANVLESLKDLTDSLTQQLGWELFESVHCSVEYSNLLNINSAIFLELDKLTAQTPALYIHNLNMERFKCKKILQETFFNIPLTELKV